MATATVPAAVPDPNDPPSTSIDNAPSGLLASMLAPVEPARPAAFDIPAPAAAEGDTDAPVAGASSAAFHSSSDGSDAQSSGRTVEKKGIWRAWLLAGAARWAKGGGGHNKRLDLAKAKANARKEDRKVSVNRSEGLLPSKGSASSAAGGKPGSGKGNSGGSGKGSVKGPKNSNGNAHQGSFGRSGGNTVSGPNGGGENGPGSSGSAGGKGSSSSPKSSKGDGPKGTTPGSGSGSGKNGIGGGSAGEGSGSGSSPDGKSGSDSSPKGDSHDKDGKSRAPKDGKDAKQAAGKDGKAVGSKGGTGTEGSPGKKGASSGTPLDSSKGDKDSKGKGDKDSQPQAKTEAGEQPGDKPFSVKDSRETGYLDGTRAARTVAHVKAYRDGIKDGWTDTTEAAERQKTQLDKAHEERKKTQDAVRDEEQDVSGAGSSADHHKPQPIEVKGIDAKNLWLGEGADRNTISRSEVRSLKTFERRLEAKATSMKKVAEGTKLLKAHAEAQAQKVTALMEATKSVKGGEKLIASLAKTADDAKVQAGEANEIHKRAVRAADGCAAVLANAKTRYGGMYKAVVDSDEKVPGEMEFYGEGTTSHG